MKDTNNPLEEIRNKIDKIDKELLSLIEKRSNFATKIFKAKDGVDIFKPRREEHLIKKLISFAKSTLYLIGKFSCEICFTWFHTIFLYINIFKITTIINK